MTDRVDTVVIGAGVVGLAVARALALAGREVVVLERNARIGEETSSRNSEVIHAGLYYPAGSLKARLCVAGKALLYDYCAAKNVAHRRCGKLIVAVHAAQRSKLEGVRRAAAVNGVNDLEPLSAADVARLEPAVRADTGLWSPSTGIVDSHGLMLALRGDIEAAGGSIATRCRCAGGTREASGWRLECATEDGPFVLGAGTVVNAAGLNAVRVAQLLGVAARGLPEPRFAKGHYFAYSGASPFSHLVYPLPDDGGLGIHATLDLAGRVRFGPDVEWLPRGTAADALDYAVDPARAASFYAAVQSYWPALPDGSLEPAYAGVRPKISGPDENAADFAIRHIGGAVHLLGIESPGLTASLAIGAHVEELLRAESGP